MTPSHDPAVLHRLRTMTIAVSREFLRYPANDGVSIDDLFHTAWVEFDKCVCINQQSQTYGFIRAEYEVRDAMSAWNEWRDKDLAVVALSQNVPVPASKRLRTKLPRVVKRALQSLTPRERRVLYMRVMLNMQHKEIAAVLQLPMGSVGREASTALKKLRVYLGVGSPDM